MKQPDSAVGTSTADIAPNNAETDKEISERTRRSQAEDSEEKERRARIQNLMNQTELHELQKQEIVKLRINNQMEGRRIHSDRKMLNRETSASPNPSPTPFNINTLQYKADLEQHFNIQNINNDRQSSFLLGQNDFRKQYSSVPLSQHLSPRTNQSPILEVKSNDATANSIPLITESSRTFAHLHNSNALRTYDLFPSLKPNEELFAQDNKNISNIFRDQDLSEIKLQTRTRDTSFEKLRDSYDNKLHKVKKSIHETSKDELQKPDNHFVSTHSDLPEQDFEFTFESKKPYMTDDQYFHSFFLSNLYLSSRAKELTDEINQRLFRLEKEFNSLYLLLLYFFIF